MLLGQAAISVTKYGSFLQFRGQASTILSYAGFCLFQLLLLSQKLASAR